MKVYLITYDLNSPGQKYDELYETIKNFGDWAHFFTSVWFVHTNMDINQMRDKLMSVIDKNDTFFINLVDDYSGYSDEELWEWLEKRI